MRKVFIFLFFTASVVLQFSCNSNTSQNSNLTNTNSATNSTSKVETNTNIQSEETPLPTFTDAETALAEGKKLLDADETEKSIEAFKQAVKLNPDLAEAYFNMGIAYALLEDEQEEAQSSSPSATTDEETTTATPAKKSKGKKEEVLKLTQSQKAFQNAAEIYEKVTKENPKDDVAFFNLGRSYNKLNKDEEAEKAFRQAVKLKPDDPDYQTELGSILIKLSHYDEAIVALKKARALDPDNQQIQDLLEKAEAGEKRIKFGISPTPPPTTQGNSKPKEDKTKQRPTPPLKIEDVPLPKPTSNK